MQAIYVTSNFQVAASSETGEFNSESFHLNQYLQNIILTHNQYIKIIIEPFYIFAPTPQSLVSILRT